MHLNWLNPVCQIGFNIMIMLLQCWTSPLQTSSGPHQAIASVLIKEVSLFQRLFSTLLLPGHNISCMQITEMYSKNLALSYRYPTCRIFKLLSSDEHTNKQCSSEFTVDKYDRLQVDQLSYSLMFIKCTSIILIWSNIPHPQYLNSIS